MAIHNIQRGENLTKIAAKYGTTLKELLELNPDLKKHPNTIFAGAELNIPDPPSDKPYPGLGIEKENDGVPKAPWHEGYEEGDVKAPSSAKADKSTDAAKENTTAGPILTLGAKEYIKRNQIKTMKPTMAKQFKSAKGKVMGKVMKVKAQHIRNTAAAKIRNARKAEAHFNAEQDKLKELRQKQADTRKSLSAERKRSYKVDAKGNKITHKPRLAARKQAKEARIDKSQKELDKLNKQVKKQSAVVEKAKVNKTATKKAAGIAKKKVTKQVNKALSKNIAKKAAAKTAAKTAGKALGKTVLKKIPIVGLAAGLIFAADRAMHGDFWGAGMEVASGAVSCVPGAGTAASVAIDVGLGAKDLHDQKII